MNAFSFVVLLGFLMTSATSYASELHLTGKRAKSLAATLENAGATVRSFVESAYLEAVGLECGTSYLPPKGVVHSCSFIDGNTQRRVDVNGLAARRLYRSLEGSGAQVKSFIESTSIWVKTASCSSTYVISIHRVVYSCEIEQ